MVRDELREVQELEAAVQAWRDRGWPSPAVVVVAGSGLAVALGPAVVGPLPLAELLPFPVHSLPGHEHMAELVEPRPGRVVLSLRGRVHAYQGYSGHQVCFMVRLARLLGAHTLVMSNAAGGVDPALSPGDLVLISDHLNLTGRTPLEGGLPAAWGPQFPDMADAYDPALRALALGHGERLGIPLREGVYAGLLGPTYETPAEVRMLRVLGADLVGMSTVQEVIAARHMGLRCLCFSLVTNLGAGVSPTPLDHDEVLVAADAAKPRVRRLLEALLQDPALLG